MARLALLLEYAGPNLHGSQFQLGVRTVQCDLEAALSAYFRRPMKTIFCGRTDSGVHAAGQVVHFDLEIEPAALSEEADEQTLPLQDGDQSFVQTFKQDEHIDLWRLCWSLNGILKSDIAVRKVQVVPDDFHARFTATSRQYVYRILNSAQRSSLLKDNHYFLPHKLDLKAMQAATFDLIGTHDFASFKGANREKQTTLCTVTRAELLNKGEGRLEFWIAANHFVYNMVRIITGTLIEIGLGKRAPDSIATALSKSDRSFTGKTAPPFGLTLHSVKYPEHYKLFEETQLS